MSNGGKADPEHAPNFVSEDGSGLVAKDIYGQVPEHGSCSGSEHAFEGDSGLNCGRDSGPDCGNDPDLDSGHALDVGPRVLMAAMLLRRMAGSKKYMHTLHEVCGRNAWILYFFHQQEEKGNVIYQKDIEQKFSMTRSGVSKMIKNMEANHIIEKRMVAGDARLKQILLTDQGRELAISAKKEKTAMEADLTAGFSQEELGEFLSYLDRLIGNLSACGYSGKGGNIKE